MLCFESTFEYPLYFTTTNSRPSLIFQNNFQQYNLYKFHILKKLVKNMLLKPSKLIYGFDIKIKYKNEKNSEKI